jgi:hypothetical protein
MLNSPKSCSEIPFSSWDFDPLTPRDYTGEEHLHAYYNASVPNIKLPQTPTPPFAAQNIPAPDGFFGCLDITAANDWWAQNNTHFGLHEFDPYAPEMAEMDPNLDLAVYQDAVAIEQNIDIYQELLRLDPSVQLFDQGPWDEPGAWQPASDCSGYNSSSGSGGHTGVETSGSSVGFNTPGSSSGDSEAPEPLVISAPARKSVLLPFHVLFIFFYSLFMIIRNTVINNHVRFGIYRAPQIVVMANPAKQASQRIARVHQAARRKDKGKDLHLN